MSFDSKYQKGHFALALTVCRISIFQTLDLENLGQGHGGEKRELMPFVSKYQPEKK